MASSTRRDFLRRAGVASALAYPALRLFADQEKEKQSGGEEVEVTPTEDLMREHGLLNRVLLIYEQCGRQLSLSAGTNPKLLTESAGIIKNFIENYHEKLEEDYLFPRFEKAGKLVDL